MDIMISSQGTCSMIWVPYEEASYTYPKLHDWQAKG